MYMHKYCVYPTISNKLKQFETKFKGYPICGKTRKE